VLKRISLKAYLVCELHSTKGYMFDQLLKFDNPFIGAIFYAFRIFLMLFSGLMSLFVIFGGIYLYYVKEIALESININEYEIMMVAVLMGSSSYAVLKIMQFLARVMTRRAIRNAFPDIKLYTLYETAAKSYFYRTIAILEKLTIKDEIVDDKTTTAFINVYMRHITLALGDFDKRVNMARTAFEKRECIRIIALERVGEK
jgi:hypothetical protein